MADIKTDEHINREALLKRIEASPLIKNYLMLRGSQTLINGILDIIKRQPAADVVEVVRCEKCVFCNYIEDSGNHKCTANRGRHGTVKPDDFCSYGERKKTDD